MGKNLFNVNETKQIHYHITNICNLSCRHCMVECPSPNPLFLDGDVVLKDIDTLCQNLDAGSFSIGFSGGEPLLHPMFFDFIDCCFSHGIQCGVVTNALFLDENKIKMLYKKGVRLGISLDGFEESHDFLRGQGAFEKVKKTLDICKEMDYRVNIHTTIHKGNIGKLDAFVEWLYNNYSIGGIDLGHAICVGRAEKELKDYFLSDAELYELFCKCQTMKLKYLSISFTHFLQQMALIKNHPCKVFACNGKECHSNSSNIPASISIMPNGDIIPLWTVLNPYFKIGNIYDNSSLFQFDDYCDSNRHIELLNFIKDTYYTFVNEENNDSKVISWVSIIYDRSNEYARNKIQVIR